MQQPHIGIVTVLYNSEDVLNDFFRTLAIQTYSNFTLYIIDNASSDRSLEIAKELASQVDFKCVFFEEKTNWGIAKGNNIGIRAALKDKCDFVLLSNNDIVLKPDTISTLLNGALLRGSGLAVPKIYYYNTNKIWQAGGRFDILRATTPHFGYKEEDHGQFEETKDVQYSSTCFMLIKSEVFDTVGFMNEDYFVYYDDSDFVYRCTMVNNEILTYIPESVLEHKVSYSTQKDSDFYISMMFRNRIYFIRQNYTFPTKALALLTFFSYHFIIHPFRMTRKQFSLSTKAMLKGLKMKR